MFTKYRLLSVFAAVAVGMAVSLSSCMDDHDEPDTSAYAVTSKTDIGAENATILEVKEKYCASSDGCDYKRNSSNFYTKVKEDVIISGVVVANDVSGNLYQTILLRNIDETKATDDPARDQCIILGVKNTALYPYFKLGQRVKVNLKGLYCGIYSKVPRIGQPTKSSYGNMNLGPMLFELLATNVQLVGVPNASAPELTPIDLTGDTGDAWLRASANKNYRNTPIFAKVRGTIDEVQGEKKTSYEKGTQDDVLNQQETLSPAGKKIFAPYELHDDGYGVDRTILLASNNSKVALRTSTKNSISFLELPEDARTYTGVVSYYDNWQVQLRDTTDISAN